MFKRSLAIGGSLILMTIIVACAYLLQTPPPPSAQVQLAGYEPFTNWWDNTKCIKANLIVTNTGNTPLSFWLSDDGPSCKIDASVAGIQTNLGGFFGPGSMTSKILIPSHCSTHVSTYLPLETKNWRVSLPIQSAGLRLKVANWAMTSKYWRRKYSSLEWGIGLLPDNSSDEKEISSSTFEIDTNKFR